MNTQNSNQEQPMALDTATQTRISHTSPVKSTEFFMNDSTNGIPTVSSAINAINLKKGVNELFQQFDAYPIDEGSSKQDNNNSQFSQQQQPIKDSSTNGSKRKSYSSELFSSVSDVLYSIVHRGKVGMLNFIVSFQEMEVSDEEQNADSFKEVGAEKNQQSMDKFKEVENDEEKNIFKQKIEIDGAEQEEENKNVKQQSDGESMYAQGHEDNEFMGRSFEDIKNNETAFEHGGSAENGENENLALPYQKSLHIRKVKSSECEEESPISGGQFHNNFLQNENQIGPEISNYQKNRVQADSYVGQTNLQLESTYKSRPHLENLNIRKVESSEYEESGTKISKNPVQKIPTAIEQQKSGAASSIQRLQTHQQTDSNFNRAFDLTKNFEASTEPSSHLKNETLFAATQQKSSKPIQFNQSWRRVSGVNIRKIQSSQYVELNHQLGSGGGVDKLQAKMLDTSSRKQQFDLDLTVVNKKNPEMKIQDSLMYSAQSDFGYFPGSKMKKNSKNERTDSSKQALQIGDLKDEPSSLASFDRFDRSQSKKFELKKEPAQQEKKEEEVAIETKKQSSNIRVSKTSHAKSHFKIQQVDQTNEKDEQIEADDEGHRESSQLVKKTDKHTPKRSMKIFNKVDLSQPKHLSMKSQSRTRQKVFSKQVVNYQDRISKMKSAKQLKKKKLEDELARLNHEIQLLKLKEEEILTQNKHDHEKSYSHENEESYETPQKNYYSRAKISNVKDAHLRRELPEISKDSFGHYKILKNAPRIIEQKSRNINEYLEQLNRIKQEDREKMKERKKLQILERMKQQEARKAKERQKVKQSKDFLLHLKGTSPEKADEKKKKEATKHEIEKETEFPQLSHKAHLNKGKGRIYSAKKIKKDIYEQALG